MIEIVDSNHCIDYSTPIPTFFGCSLYIDVPVPITRPAKNYGPRGDDDWQMKKPKRGRKRK